MRFTKKLEEAIHQYNLELIHTGRLGYPGSRYLDNELYFGWPKSNGQYVFEFNYFDHLTDSWLTFEKKCKNQKEALEIKKKEFNRKLWDSRQLYFESDGKRLLLSV